MIVKNDRENVYESFGERNASINKASPDEIDVL